MNGEESYVDYSAVSKYENAKSSTKEGVNTLDTSSNANQIKALVKTLWWTIYEFTARIVIANIALIFSTKIIAHLWSMKNKTNNKVFVYLIFLSAFTTYTY